LTRSGFAPLNAANLSKANIQRVFLFGNLDLTSQEFPHEYLRSTDALCALFPGVLTPAQWIDSWLQLIFLQPENAYEEPFKRTLARLSVEGACAVFRSHHVERFDQLKSKPLPTWYLQQRQTRLALTESWTYLGDVRTSEVDPFLKRWASDHSAPSEIDTGGDSVALWTLAAPCDFEIEGEELMTSLWNRFIQQEVIPYDLTERKTRLAYAYSELAPYVERHEVIAARDRPAFMKARNWRPI
jgi:hypothetical protein